jgi:hypothetical protein
MESTALDGHLVTTHRFSSTQPPDRLADELRARWQAEGKRFVESRRGEWHLLSTRRGDTIESLQLRARGEGSEGLHSLWQPDADWTEDPVSRERRAMHGLLRRWLPSSAVPIRELIHRDGERFVATMVATGGEPEAVMAAVLQRNLTAVGFIADPVPQPGDARGLRRTKGRALAFRRDGEELVATLAAHRGETAIVLHWSRQR